LEEKKGEFVIRLRKKKREIIEESHNQINIPSDIDDEEKRDSSLNDCLDCFFFFENSLFD